MADITLRVTFTIRDRFYTDDEKTVIDSVIRLAESNGWKCAIVTGPAASESDLLAALRLAKDALQNAIALDSPLSYWEGDSMGLHTAFNAVTAALQNEKA